MGHVKFESRDEYARGNANLQMRRDYLERPRRPRQLQIFNLVLRGRQQQRRNVGFQSHFTRRESFHRLPASSGRIHSNRLRRYRYQHFSIFPSQNCV